MVITHSWFSSMNRFSHAATWFGGKDGYRRVRMLVIVSESSVRVVSPGGCVASESCTVYGGVSVVQPYNYGKSAQHITTHGFTRSTAHLLACEERHRKSWPNVELVKATHCSAHGRE